MTPLQTLILGIIQGVTEFIPVSSSAHLVLIPWLLGWSLDERPAFVFNVLVQVGTLVAVIAYFRRDLMTMTRCALLGIARGRPLETPEARTAWLLVLATIPAGVIGLAFKDYFVSTYSNPVQTAVELMGTSLIIWISELIGRRLRGFETIDGWDAAWMGVGQAIAIFPGISRSAATIAFGLGRNLERPSAARFSFLMSIPIFLAAGLMAVYDLLRIPNFMTDVPEMLIGFAASAVVGYLCIRWLLRFLAHHPMMVFAYYCTGASIFFLLVAFFRG